MPEEPGSKTISPSPTTRRASRGLTILLNLVLLAAVIAAGVLFVRAEQQRRSVENELKKTSAELEEVKKSTQRSGAEVAKDVLEKVRRHIEVPSDPLPSVATIVDIEKLRQASEFYKTAENGDHLIITAKRAILYSPKKDLILDVVPIQVNTTATPQPSGKVSPKASAVPTASSVPVSSPTAS